MKSVRARLAVSPGFLIWNSCVISVNYELDSSHQQYKWGVLHIQMLCALLQWNIRTMSEFELLQMFEVYAAKSIGVYMNYITMLSGYLIASYFIAKNLTKLQFSILNVVYTAVAILTLLTFNRAIYQSEVVFSKLSESETTLVFQNPIVSLGNVSSLTIIVMYIVSIIFAFSIRKGVISST